MRPFVFFFLALGACSTEIGNSRGGPHGKEGLEMRLYDLPKGLGEPVRSVLSRVFYKSEDEPPIGRAELGPDGKLVVVATPSVHEGVTSLLAGFEGKAPPPAVSIRMQYWLVIGERSENVEIGAGLEPVSDALRAVSDVDGKSRFSMFDRLDVRAVADERVEATSTRVDLEQTAGEREGVIHARIHLSPQGPANIMTNVAIRPDQTLVLGSNGYPRNIAFSTEGSGPDVTLYYVVRASLERSGAEGG